jgi:hypothetical protein
MNLTTVYSKTAKGVQAITQKGKRLPAGLARALSLVDGRATVEEILEKAGEPPTSKLPNTLADLAKDGYLKAVTTESLTEFSIAPDTSASMIVSETVDETFFKVLAETETRKKLMKEAAENPQEARQKAHAKAAAMAEEEAMRREIKAREAAEAEERSRQEGVRQKIAAAMALEEAALKARREAENQALRAKAAEEADRRVAAERKAQEEEAKKRAWHVAEQQKIADAKAREEAEHKARKETAEKKKAEAEERARQEAQASAAKEASTRAAAERKAQEEAAAKERVEASKQRRLEARAREEAERKKAREEAEARARAEAEERKRLEAEAEERARRKAEEQARAEEAARIKAEAEAREREEAERKAREEAEAREKREAEERERREAEENARAEEAARAKTETEAREREEAERKARLAAEARAIAEAEERARREAERKILEQEEAQAKARAEAERKAREEAEQEQRERAEIEARARALADARAEETEKARQKELAKPKQFKRPVKLGRAALIALAALLVLPIVLLHVMNLNIFIPPIEKLASDRMGEPVSIHSMRASLWPAPHLKLDGVTIGKLRDIKIPTVRVMPELAAFFGEAKAIKSIEAESLAIDQDALSRVIAWVGPGDSTAKTQVRRIALKTATIEVKGLPLPPLAVDVALTATGQFEWANIRSTDKKIEVTITPKKNNGFEVNIAANDWQPPLWPNLTFSELRAKAVATSEDMTFSEIGGRLYGGKATGSATVKWGDSWSAEGDLKIENILLAEAMPALTNDIAVTGKLDAKTVYSMQAGDLGTLFDNPRVQANFSIRDGAIGNIDLARAIQPRATETSGGKTLFASLSGSLALEGQRYQYRQMKLAAGLLTASGEADIMPNKQLSGKTSVEMKLKSSTVSARLTLSGELQQPVLRR